MEWNVFLSRIILEYTQNIKIGYGLRNLKQVVV